jgi:hypothetical protein
MGIAERKHRFVEQFMQIDDVDKIKQFEELLNRDIVAFTVQGKPLNSIEYKNAVLLSEQNGQYLSVVELEKMVEEW